MKISKPKSIDEFALTCLEALESSKYIVLGDAFALAHYHEYRTTKNIDAWWTEDAGEKEKEAVVDLLKTALEEFGEVAVRRFGDVVSIDLRQKNRVVFNFQVAARSALLRPPSVKEKHWIDGSLYPDQEVPESLDTLEDRIDFIARVCGAWDFGVLPLPQTLSRILKPDWKQAVDETELLTSCAYHLLRDLHGLKPLPYLGPQFPEILNDPYLEWV